MSDSVQPHRRQPIRLPRPWDSPGKNTRVGCHFLLQCMKVKSEREVAQSCLTLRDPMDCSLPGSSVHGIFQARILEWGAIDFSSLFHYPPSIMPPVGISAVRVRYVFSCSVMFNSLRLEWAAISYTWDLPHRGTESCFLCLLYWQLDSLPLSHVGSPKYTKF